MPKEHVYVKKDFQCPKHHEKIEFIDLTPNCTKQEIALCSKCFRDKENIFHYEKVFQFLEKYQREIWRVLKNLHSMTQNFNGIKNTLFELIDKLGDKVEMLGLNIQEQSNVDFRLVQKYFSNNDFNIDKFANLMEGVSKAIKVQDGEINLKVPSYTKEDQQIFTNSKDCLDIFYELIKKVGAISKIKVQQFKLENFRVPNFENIYQKEEIQGKLEEIKKQTQLLKLEVLNEIQVGINVVEFNKKGDVLVAGTNFNEMTGTYLDVWKIDKEKAVKLQSLKGHTSDVISLCFKDNDNSFFSGSRDRTILCWKAVKEYDWQVAQILKGFMMPVFCVQINGAATCLASGSENLRLWEQKKQSDSWLEFTCFENHEDSISSLCFNEDGTLLVTGGAKGVIIIFQYVYCMWQYKQTLQAHQSFIVHLSFTNSYDFISATHFEIGLWPYSKDEDNYYVLRALLTKSNKFVAFNRLKQLLAVAFNEGEGAFIYQMQDNEFNSLLIDIKETIKIVKFHQEDNIRFAVVMKDKLQVWSSE